MMTPGELVQLSAYVKSLKLWMHLRGKVGLLISVDAGKDVYVVKWTGQDTREHGMQRKDIKRVK